MKKFLQKIVIEYPIVSILVFFLMLFILYEISVNNSTYKYLEYDKCRVMKDGNGYFVSVVCDAKYYNQIITYNNIIWYSNNESEIHNSKIEKIICIEDKCYITIKLLRGDVESEAENEITVKICYARESLLEHMIGARRSNEK